MKETEHYKLQKPESSDFIDIDDFNKNADVVDEELKRNKDDLSSFKNTKGEENGLAELDSDSNVPKSQLKNVDVPVKSVNEKTGEVKINKSDVGLGSVKDEEQATKSEFNNHVADESVHFEKSDVSKADIGLGSVKDKEQLGKSETAKNSETLEGKSLEEVRSGVTQSDVGLSKVVNEEQATKSEFDNHKNNKDAHTSEKEKESWDGKETVEGAQQKANKALDDAKKHTDDEVGKIPDLTWPNLSEKPSKFPSESHKHSISDVTDLQTNLDNKATSESLEDHEVSSMPHQFKDGSTTYKYGFKTNSDNDGLVFVYEEV